MASLSSRRSNVSRKGVAALSVIAAVALALTVYAAFDTSSSRGEIVDGGLGGAQAGDAMPTADHGGAVADQHITSVESFPATDAELGADDGYIPDGVTLSPFDTEAPAIARLDAGLLAAVQAAAAAARADGVDLGITSGWRSTRYQQRLLDEAIVTYGSESEALKWVSTADQSTHVTGNAVDVGPTEAAMWLGQYGSSHGLCQTYANEIWHFELTVDSDGTCPEPLPDASAR